MYFQQSEHQPPHIHAIYAEYSGPIIISDGSILHGVLPAYPVSLILLEDGYKNINKN